MVRPPEGGLPGQSSSIIYKYIGDSSIDEIKVFWPKLRNTRKYKVKESSVTLCRLGRVLKGVQSCLD